MTSPGNLCLGLQSQTMEMMQCETTPHRSDFHNNNNNNNNIACMRIVYVWVYMQLTCVEICGSGSGRHTSTISEIYPSRPIYRARSSADYGPHRDVQCRWLHLRGSMSQMCQMKTWPQCKLGRVSGMQKPRGEAAMWWHWAQDIELVNSSGVK
jgi:hypothetical protein